MFEVEVKYRIASVVDLEQQLQKRFGAAFGQEVTESDLFFQHPCRNFIETDECLRLRSRIFPDGSSQYFLTYKGPKIDINTKTRREIEMPIALPEICEEMLAALGFQQSAAVQKHRRRVLFTVENRQIEIVSDTLPALPETCRYFAELETMTSESDINECKTLLLNIADRLGMKEPIRESYLKLVQTYGEKQLAER